MSCIICWLYTRSVSGPYLGRTKSVVQVNVMTRSKKGGDKEKIQFPRLKAFHLIAQGIALGKDEYHPLRPVRAKDYSLISYALTGRKFVRPY